MIGLCEYSTPLEWELGRYCAELLRPAPNLQVWQWAEENIYLSERSSALPGRFSTLLTPYIREPLQAYADRRVTDLALCFGTQTAKTTVVMIGTAYRIVNDPTPALWVMPSGKLATSFSKTRWKPMVNDCAVLRDQKPADRHLFGNEEQHFAKVTLNFVGSNSPSNLSSRPAGLLNLDETDKFQVESEREAGALQLAEERTKTFPFPLRVKTSTPTTVHGDIWREFLLGDQRYYYLPCPHCSQSIESDIGIPISGQNALLTWEDLTEDQRRTIRDTWITLKFTEKSDQHGDCGVRWWRDSEDESKTASPEGGMEWDMEKVRQNAFYKCQRCGGAIFDHDKPAMLRAGIWMPTNPRGEPGRKSYHLNSLYSLLGRECRFGAIAIKWLQTKGSMTKRHNFINSTLAECWDEERSIDDQPIFKEEYDRTRAAEGAGESVTIMSVDLQQNHTWVIIRRWVKPTRERPMGESWLLFAGRVEGGDDELDALEKKHGVEPMNVILDIAHFTSMACRWLVEHGWRGAWGSEKNGFIHTMDDGSRLIRPWSPVQHRDVLLGADMRTRLELAHLVGKHADFIFWSNDTIKDQLAILRHTEPTIFHVHADVPADYQKHLNAEIKTVKKSFSTGRILRYYWKQLRAANHLNDCECMNLLRAMRLGYVPMPDDQPAAVQRVLSLN